MNPISQSRMINLLKRSKLPLCLFLAISAMGVGILMSGWAEEHPASGSRMQFILSSPSDQPPEASSPPGQDLPSDRGYSLISQAQPMEESIDLAGLFKRGKDLYRAGNYSESIEYFEQILAVDPEYDGVQDYLSQARQRLVRAESQNRQQDARQLVSDGDQLFRQGYYDHAIQSYEQALELDPSNSRAQRGLQRAVAEREKTAAQADQQQFQARVQQLLQQAKQKYDENDFDGAIDTYSKALELDPNNREAQRWIVRARSQKQSLEQDAAREYVAARFRAAQALVDSGDYEAAINAANEILEIDSRHSGARRILSAAQSGIEQREKSALEAERLAAQDEINQYIGRARVYFEADHLDQAEAELATILETYPDERSAQDLMQQIARRRQAIEAEQQKLAEAARKAEEAERAARLQQLSAKAKQLYAQAQILEAVDIWNEMLEIQPGNTEALAFLEQTKSEYEAAIQAKEESKALAAREAEIQALLDQNVPLLDLKNTDIDHVLSLIGTISGFNIVATHGVDGIITVNIRNKSVREALDLILIPNGFKYTVTDKDIVVTTDFRTRIFPLSAEQYDKVERILEDPTSLEDPSKELRRLIYGDTAITTIPGKEIRLNPSTRSLIVTDTQENIQKVEAFLVDIPEFVKAKEPLVSRHYKLNPDSARKVFNIIELQLYGELGRRTLSPEDPRLLILEPDTNIMIVKDTLDRVKEVEAILQNQSLLDRLQREELVAREFRLSLEPEPPEGASRTEWLYRREQEVNFVLDILNQMLYGFEGQEEAIAKGRRIFRRTDYNLENDGTITVVDTPDNVKKVEDFLSQAHGRGQTMVEAIHIKHADINALLNLLNRVTGRTRTTTDGDQSYDEDIDRALRLRITLHADPASQSIIVRGQAQQREQLDAVKDLIAKLDVPVPQVEIESRLVELRLEDNRGLSFDYDFFNLFEDKLLIGDKYNRTTALNLISEQAEGMAFSMSTLGHTRFNFAMNAIEKLSNAEILSAPKITVVSDAEATINIVTNEPYISNIEVNTMGTDTPTDDQLILTFDVEPIGITLTVTPTVLGDRSVVMNVNPSITTQVGRIPVQVAAVAGGGAQSVGAIQQLGQLIIAERSAETRVKVKDGDTLVIGGLIRDELLKSVDKVPLLGDIPWLGRFFRDTTTTNTKSQLLIFMTVRILPDL